MRPQRSRVRCGASTTAHLLRLLLLMMVTKIGIHCAELDQTNSDIEVLVNGGVTTSRYLSTTRPLPTGILVSNAPTFVSKGITSEFTTLVVGTVVGGLYSRIVSTDSRVFYRVPVASQAAPVSDSSRVPTWLSTVIPQLQNSILTQADYRVLADSAATTDDIQSFQERMLDGGGNSVEKQRAFNLNIQRNAELSPFESKEADFITGYENDDDLGGDLFLSGSDYTTVTYVGFSNYETTIGNTVVVFMPNSAKVPNPYTDSSQTRSGRGLPYTRAPVFVPNSRPAKTRIVPADAVSTNEVVTAVESKVSSTPSVSVQSTVTTRVFNTVDFYPTGLVTSIGGAVTLSRVTTVFTTLVYGTFIDGRYAKVIKSTSSIYYSTDQSVQPAPTVLAKSVGTVTATVRSGLGRAIASGSKHQIIVDSAALDKLRQKDFDRSSSNEALESSMQQSVPALFSSLADREEERSVLRTYYTTHTYFTTISDDLSTIVSSSLSTESRVATEQLKTKPITIYTTFTYFSTFYKGERKTVSTRYITKSHVGSRPILPVDSAVSFRYVTKTYFTTYTYLTTSFNGVGSTIQSRLVTTSNVVTSKETINEYISDVILKTPSKSNAPIFTGSGMTRFVKPVASVSTEGVNKAFAHTVLDLIPSTGFQNTFGRNSADKTFWLGSDFSTKDSPFDHSTLPIGIISPTSSFQNLVKTTYSSKFIDIEIKPVSFTSSTLSTRQQFTNRNFLPFRTSGERKSGGLLARLALSKGFNVGSDSSEEEPNLHFTPTTPTSVVATLAEHDKMHKQTIPTIFNKPLLSKTEPNITIKPRRPSVAAFERSFRNTLGLRGLISVGDSSKKFAHFKANEKFSEEEPIDPTEVNETIESSELTEASTTTTSSTPVPKILTFERTRSVAHGTRNSLPLRRRGKNEKRKGLAGLFSAVSGVSVDVNEADDNEVIYTTTDSSTIETTTDEPEETSTLHERRIRPIASSRRSGRQRGIAIGRRRRPSIRSSIKTNTESASLNEDTTQSSEVTTTSRNTIFRPFRPRRRLLRSKRSFPHQPILSSFFLDQNSHLSYENDKSDIKLRTKRQTRSRGRRVRPSQTQQREQFTLTPQRARNAPIEGQSSFFSRSASNTRRTVPSGRRQRPSTVTTSPETQDIDRPSISLRQRLAQAQFSGSRKRNGPTAQSPTDITPQSFSRTTLSNQRRESNSLTPGRTTRPSFSLNARDRTRPLSSSREPSTAAPIPLESSSQNDEILIISETPIRTEIPVTTNGVVTSKEVITASEVTKTYELDQLTTFDANGVQKVHIGISTSVIDAARTAFSTLFIEPTEIEKIITRTYRDGNRRELKTQYSSVIQPAYTVEPLVTTRSNNNLLNNVNPLTSLLQQLLTGQNLQHNQANNFAINQPTQPQYKTVYSTTSYVTTVGKSEGTTVPVFMNGRLTETIIYDTSSKVLTVTEVITTSTLVTAQSVAPALGGNFGFGAGINPQQLLLQQLLQNQFQQQRQFHFAPIQPTPQTPQPVQLLQTQPPQLQELLRQATEVTQSQQLQNQPLIQRFQRSLSSELESSEPSHWYRSIIGHEPQLDAAFKSIQQLNQFQATASLESVLGKVLGVTTRTIDVKPTKFLEKHKAATVSRLENNSL